MKRRESRQYFGGHEFPPRYPDGKAQFDPTELTPFGAMIKGARFATENTKCWRGRPCVLTEVSPSPLGDSLQVCLLGVRVAWQQSQHVLQRPPDPAFAYDPPPRHRGCCASCQACCQSNRWGGALSSNGSTEGSSSSRRGLFHPAAGWKAWSMMLCQVNQVVTRTPNSLDQCSTMLQHAFRSTHRQ